MQDLHFSVHCFFLFLFFFLPQQSDLTGWQPEVGCWQQSPFIPSLPKYVTYLSL